MSEFVLVSEKDGVGTITFNRPEALNAFNLELAQSFLSVLADFDGSNSVRALVIRGSGRIFSCGGDIKEMLADVRAGEDAAAYFRKPLSAFGDMIMAIRTSRKPVLAAVHGAAAGVAFNLALACDLRIATETSRFTQAFIKIGVSPDGGGTWLLPRLVGMARAAQLALLPTELDANSALEWGLLNWVVPEEEFEDQVSEIATSLAKGPSAAMGRAKALLNQAFDTGLPDQIEAERLAQIRNADSPDFAEGLAAFVEKRLPNFRG